jgi:hypothetical protein
MSEILIFIAIISIILTTSIIVFIGFLIIKLIFEAKNFLKNQSDPEKIFRQDSYDFKTELSSSQYSDPNNSQRYSTLIKYSAIAYSIITWIIKIRNHRRLKR